MKDVSGQRLIHESGNGRSLGLPVQSPAIRRTIAGSAERADAGVDAAFPFAALATLIPPAINAVSKLF